MAGQVSEKELGSVLTQAMLAAKNIRPQRDRLLQLRRRLKQQSPSSGEDDKAWIGVLAMDLVDVYFIGIEYGARVLSRCLEMAAKNGGRPKFNNIALAVIPDEQLYGVLLAQRFPARPTTQAEAFSLVEVTLFAIKLLQEHHVPRCIELLVGERPPNVTGDPPVFSGMCGYSDDPVSAAMEHIAKNGLPKRAAASTRKATGKDPQAATSIDLDQALTYLHRACSLASLAISHIDLAVAVISTFVDPDKVSSLSEYTDKRAYISEKGPYPSD